MNEYIYEPKINDNKILEELTLNSINPLEILREFIHNSIDAESSKISIILDRNSQKDFTISFIDNGNGMDIDEVKSFFNVGYSNKTRLDIGEKGIGSIIALKSKKIILNTYKDGKFIEAIMDQPWNQIKSNVLPKYYIKKSEVIDKVTTKGTSIRIEGYIVDDTERIFNISAIKDYIQWHTAGGSFKQYFANNQNVRTIIRNIEKIPEIIIIDNINNITETILGIHQFAKPNEIINRNTNIKYASSIDYCRHFGPFHRETNINGKYVSVQLYGTISGTNSRNSILQHRENKTHKSKFGIYLCKDFIPIIRKNTLLKDEKYYHYHIMANSQNFNLTSDRNNISNLNDIECRWVISQIEEIVNKIIKPLADKEYFSLRKKEEYNFELVKKQQSIKSFAKKIDLKEQLLLNDIPILKKPSSEYETSLLLVSLLSNNNTCKYIDNIEKVVVASSRAAIDLICIDSNKKFIYTEIEYILSNLFIHKHPIKLIDCIVCWKNDLNINQVYEINEEQIIIINENNNYYLIVGDKKINIIELRIVVDRIINKEINEKII